MINRFFPSAQEGRLESRNNLFIFREIRDIEEQVLLAQKEGFFEVSISNTGMTTVSSPPTPTQLTGDEDDDTLLALGIHEQAKTYFNVWQGLQENTAIEEQMKAVIKYFTDLGYSCFRQTNQSTLTTFVWVLKW